MDQFTPEHPPLPPQEVEAVSAELERHRENPEHGSLSGQELVKKAIQSYTNSGTLPADKSADELPDYVESAPPQVKHEIEHLLGLVFEKGILAANAEAAKSGPFVLDAFHDALAGKLHPELKKRGFVD